MSKYPDNKKIAVIGLGYVGLPVAVEFSKKRPVLGFDINKDRIGELNNGVDRSMELSPLELKQAKNLSYSSDVEKLRDCGIFIVTVPTPVDRYNRPDLSPLILACETVGRKMQIGSIVIFESTVYPGATEEVCVPVLEEYSGKKFNRDFFCGYSPERINPGDHTHRLDNIIKVTSGSTPEVAEFVDQLYREIIPAGTYLARSIRVAEAAKVIENTQRDLNIALMNELSLIFHKLGIDTMDVIEAASTKWNFMPFRPGLVGGHCIGIDPYYLTYKAQEVGYHPEVILAGRRINDGMPGKVADRVVKLMLRKEISVSGSRLLILGLTFKENCPDIRNSKVVDLVKCFEEYAIQVDIYDPWVDVAEVYREFGLKCSSNWPLLGDYSAIVLAVGHRQFLELGENELKALGKPNAVLFDVKSIFPLDATDGRL